MIYEKSRYYERQTKKISMDVWKGKLCQIWTSQLETYIFVLRSELCHEWKSKSLFLGQSSGSNYKIYAVCGYSHDIAAQSTSITV